MRAAVRKRCLSFGICSGLLTLGANSFMVPSLSSSTSSGARLRDGQQQRPQRETPTAVVGRRPGRARPCFHHPRGQVEQHKREEHCPAPLLEQEEEQQHLKVLREVLQRRLLIPVCCLALSLGVGLGLPSLASAMNENQQFMAETWRTVDRLYYDRTFNGVDWFQVRKNALEAAKNVESDTELYKAVSDMMGVLGDKYTRFLPPSQYVSLVQGAKGELAGIGVTITEDPATNVPSVGSVEDKAPAAEAGMQTGDLMVRIDGTDMKGRTPDDAAAILRGVPGTRVGIVVERPGQEGKLDFILTRKSFQISSVKSSTATIGGKRVGVIRIKSFSANTAESVRQELEKFRKGGNVAGIVIDLRGNPGGLLPGGVDTAKLFLESGREIVSVKSKAGRIDTQTTSESGPETAVPLVLVVDDKTASSSEVFSAAMKENDRAKLVGTKTFGKGIIQSVEPLSNNAGVAVTIAAYETPKHNNINKVGISVDVEVECPPTKEAATCVPPQLL